VKTFFIMTNRLRLSMARRKAKRRTSRRKNVNLLNLAQGVVVGNAVTQGFFNNNIYEFLTGRVDGAFAPGGDGSSKISLPELVGFGSGGLGGNIGGVKPGTLGKTVQANFSANGGMMIGTVLLAPFLFKFGKKAMRPLLSAGNTMLRGSGVTLG